LVDQHAALRGEALRDAGGGVAGVSRGTAPRLRNGLALQGETP